MAALWTGGAAQVRQVAARLGRRPPLAYTTVMTTLDRLHRKGLLARHKEGQAFVYEAAVSQDEYRARIVGRTVAGLMAPGESAMPLLAAFVDAAADLDEANLTALESLIAERRKGGK